MDEIALLVSSLCLVVYHIIYTVETTSESKQLRSSRHRSLMDLWVSKHLPVLPNDYSNKYPVVAIQLVRNVIYCAIFIGGYTLSSSFRIITTVTHYSRPRSIGGIVIGTCLFGSFLCWAKVLRNLVHLSYVIGSWNPVTESDGEGGGGLSFCDIDMPPANKDKTKSSRDSSSNNNIINTSIGDSIGSSYGSSTRNRSNSSNTNGNRSRNQNHYGNSPGRADMPYEPAARSGAAIGGSVHVHGSGSGKYRTQSVTSQCTCGTVEEVTVSNSRSSSSDINNNGIGSGVNNCNGTAAGGSTTTHSSDIDIDIDIEGIDPYADPKTQADTSAVMFTRELHYDFGCVLARDSVVYFSFAFKFLYISIPYSFYLSFGPIALLVITFVILTLETVWDYGYVISNYVKTILYGLPSAPGVEDATLEDIDGAVGDDDTENGGDQDGVGEGTEHNSA